MMQKRFKITILYLLLFIFSVLPFLVVAETKLQQTYPIIGSLRFPTLVAGSKGMGNLIKYIFAWIVVLCILAAIIALIAGGVQYVASTGNIDKMRQAKERIYGAFLGLAILIGTWFILNTINPQLSIVKIAYEPINKGIFLFSQDSFEQLQNSSDKTIITELVQKGEAVRLLYDTPDLTELLGPLLKKRNQNDCNNNTIPSITFRDLDIDVVCFGGIREAKSIVVFYPQKNYGFEDPKHIRYFSAEGEVNSAGTVLKNQTEEIYTYLEIPSNIDQNSKNKYRKWQSNSWQFQSKISCVTIHSQPNQEPISYYNSPTKLILNSQSQEEVNPKIFDKDTIKNQTPQICAKQNCCYVGLSLKIIHKGPGVYLISEKEETRYFDSNVADLSKPEINFNQLAKKIRIINDAEVQNEKEEHDFLVILHTKDHFSGNLKIFLQARRYDTDSNKTSPKAKGKYLPAYNADGTPVFYDNLPDNSKTNYEKDGKFAYFKKGIFGNLPTIDLLTENDNYPTNGCKYRGNTYNNPILLENLIKISETDIHNNSDLCGGMKGQAVYGKIPDDKSISSLQIYELADDPSACKEVRICTQHNYRGYCIAYVPKSYGTHDEYNTIFYPMPLYVPQNIPCPIDSFTGDTSANYPYDCIIERIKVKTEKSEQKAVYFFQHIKSIQIKGKCAVALFDERLVANTNTNNTNTKPPTDKPTEWYFTEAISGAHSEVFTESDPDLEDNPIGLCGSIGLFNRWIGKDCASAIVVFPIK